MKLSEAENLHAWDQYQHSKIGNNVEERIRLFDSLSHLKLLIESAEAS